MNPSQTFLESSEYFLYLQRLIKKEIEKLSKGKFKKTNWHYKKSLSDSGGGISLALGNNPLFEKVGLNFSQISGKFDKSLKRLLKRNITTFSATGISLVFHPTSPLVPTIHMNLRYFESKSQVSWFGGGVDLTPFYPFIDDFQFFHSTLKNYLDRLAVVYYPRFKKKCDEYFYLPHRQEMRGIGGIFFDNLKGNEKKNFNIVKAVGESFLPSYIPILEKRKNQSYQVIHRDFQLFRRGRYVEFNLLYDQGTKFGFKSGGRIESILMSLPPLVAYPHTFPSDRFSFSKIMTGLYQKRKWV